jgi:G2/mitotic-specific cyclin 1/2
VKRVTAAISKVEGEVNEDDGRQKRIKSTRTATTAVTTMSSLSTTAIPLSTAQQALKARAVVASRLKINGSNSSRNGTTNSNAAVLTKYASTKSRLASKTSTTMPSSSSSYSHLGYVSTTYQPSASVSSSYSTSSSSISHIPHNHTHIHPIHHQPPPAITNENRPPSVASVASTTKPKSNVYGVPPSTVKKSRPGVSTSASTSAASGSVSRRPSESSITSIPKTGSTTSAVTRPTASPESTMDIDMDPVPEIVSTRIAPVTNDVAVPKLDTKHNHQQQQQQQQQPITQRDSGIFIEDDSVEYQDEYDRDPALVAEYATEIFTYLKQKEVQTMADPQYMLRQSEISWNMRATLVNWLAEVHHRLKLLPETLFLTVNLMDRFLTLKAVSVAKFQLVGITSFFVACKYEEVLVPSVQTMVYLVDNGYTADEILKAEKYLLGMVKFDVGSPGPLSFLRRISRADGFDVNTRTLAKYFVEMTLCGGEEFLVHRPSVIAAAGMYLARKMLTNGDWVS